MKKYLMLFVITLSLASNAKAQSTNYFPHSPGDTSTLSSFTIKWYSDQLAALAEPVLYSDQTSNEIYRFTWLRTFHHPIAIRIEKHKNLYFLFWKQCDGSGGYKAGKLITDKQKIISKETWDQFTDQLRSINFWAMNTNLKTFGNDGSQWILEGKSKSYHVVDRWTPNIADNYYKCCDFLIKLTDLKIKADEKY